MICTIPSYGLWTFHLNLVENVGPKYPIHFGNFVFTLWKLSRVDDTGKCTKIPLNSFLCCEMILDLQFPYRRKPFFLLPMDFELISLFPFLSLSLVYLALSFHTSISISTIWSTSLFDCLFASDLVAIWTNKSIRIKFKRKIIGSENKLIQNWKRKDFIEFFSLSFDSIFGRTMRFKLKESQ